MIPRPALVVGAWTVANLVLAAVMFAFGENVLFIGLYFVASVPVLALAVVSAAVEQRGAGPPAAFQLGQRAGLMLPIAAGLCLVGFGLIYLTWIAIVGAVIAAFATAALLRSPASEPAGPDDEVLPYPPRPQLHASRAAQPEPVTRPGWRRAGLVGAALAAWVALTRTARRRQQAVNHERGQDTTRA